MRPLDIYEFNLLNRQEQVSYMYDQCTFLMQRKEDDRSRVNLYHAGDFFVELWYDTLTHQLGRVRSFNTTLLLEPYLENLALPSVSVI
jgi:hypothetical protein